MMLRGAVIVDISSEATYHKKIQDIILNFNEA